VPTLISATASNEFSHSDPSELSQMLSVGLPLNPQDTNVSGGSGNPGRNNACGRSFTSLLCMYLADVHRTCIGVTCLLDHTT